MIVKPLEQIEVEQGRKIVICVAKSKGKNRKWQYSSALGLGHNWRYYKTNSTWVHQKWLAQHYLGLEQSKSIMAFSVDTFDLDYASKTSIAKVWLKKGKPVREKTVLNFKDRWPDLNYVVFDDKEYNAFNKLLTDKKAEEKVWETYK